MEARALAADAGAISGQARASFGGFAGLDLAGCIETLTARGHPRSITAILLPYWDAGLRDAAAAQREAKDT